MAIIDASPSEKAKQTNKRTLHICLDPKDLNEDMRENYPLPMVDAIAAP